MEFEARRNAIKAKVALLEKEEEKRRYRAKALQQGINGDDLSPHTMTRYLQQVTESDVPVQQNDDSKVVQKVGDSEPKFEPEAWNPSLPSKK